MNAFEQRCHEYLEGALSPDETLRFERDLAQPENMELFREVLFTRELLQSLGPDEAPTGLAERIEQHLGVARQRANVETTSAGVVSSLAAMRASLQGFGWMFRGAALATGAARGESGGRETLQGLGMVRYALGPLTYRPFSRSSSETAVGKPSRPSRVWLRRLAKLVR